LLVRPNNTVISVILIHDGKYNGIWIKLNFRADYFPEIKLLRKEILVHTFLGLPLGLNLQ